MFEDSTFESNGKIRTRSSRWALVALIFNCAILALIILLPLIFPEAIHNQQFSILLITPLPPAQIAEAPKPTQQQPKPLDSSPMQSQLTAPRIIPLSINFPDKPEPSSTECNDCVPGGVNIGTTGPRMPKFVTTSARVVTPQTLRVPSTVTEGMLISKTLPVYPAIGLQVRVQGTVVLAAIISKTGTIESLHVVSGPPMLQQAALDAVKTWRYRPYLLNGEAVEVETAVNIVFKLDQ